MFSRYIKKIMVIFFLIFQFSINAETSCALNSTDQVKDFSYEICKKDESFRILYEMFPNFFDDVLFTFEDFGEIEELKDEPEIVLNNQYRKYSNLMYEVFGSITRMITYLIVFFVFYYAFFTMLKSAESGGFLDYNNQSLLKTIGYSSIAIFMLLPFGNLIMAQILILLIAVLGISVANYIYGYYLASLQINTEMLELDEKEIEKQILTDKYTNNTSILASQAYVSQLTKVAMCKNASSQILLQAQIYNINSDNYDKKRKCVSGNEYLQKDNPEEYPNFFTLDYNTVYQHKDRKLEQLSKIGFGVKEQKSCEQESFVSYECGSLEIRTPKVNSNELIHLYGIEKFYNSVISIAQSLNVAGGNQAIIERGWQNIKNDIMSKINTIANQDVSPVTSSQNEITQNRIAKELLNKRDLTELKKLSYIYHQLILNASTTGLNLKTDRPIKRKIGYAQRNNSSLNIEYDTLNIFSSDWENVKKLANNIEENHCNLNSEGLYRTYNLEKKLKNQKTNGEITSRCFDFINKKAFGVVNGEPYKKEQAKSEAESKLIALTEEYNQLVLKVAKRRYDVDVAFINSLKELSDTNLLGDLRQRGWLTMPTYIMELSRDIKINNLYLKSLTSSNSFKALQVDNNMVSTSLITEAERNVLATSYPAYVNLSNPFKYFMGGRSPDSIYTDNASYSQSLLQDNQESISRDSLELESFFNSLTSSPLTPLKRAVGLEMVDNLGDATRNKEILEQCSEDFEKCPMPKKDPIVELNRYGHYLIATSINYYATIITMKGIVGIGKATSAKIKAEKKKTKIEETTGSLGETVLGNLADDPISSKAISKIAEALDIMSEILAAFGSLVIMMLFIGVFLAYILPLIPLMYYMVGFLSWLLMIIQILFVAPVWAVYFIKYNDHKEVIVNAAKTYGLQILLKPAFMVIGLIFAWELIKISLFFLNITVTPLMDSIVSDDFIFSWIQEILFVLIYCVLIFIIIKFVLDILTNLSDQLLTMLGVESSHDMMDNKGSNEILQYYLIDAGIGAKNELADTVLLEGSDRQRLLKAKLTNAAAEGVLLADKAPNLAAAKVNETVQKIKTNRTKTKLEKMLSIEEPEFEETIEQLNNEDLKDVINKLDKNPTKENTDKIEEILDKMKANLIGNKTDIKFQEGFYDIEDIPLEKEGFGAMINSENELITYYVDNEGNIITTKDIKMTKDELQIKLEEAAAEGETEIHLNENGEKNE